MNDTKVRGRDPRSVGPMPHPPQHRLDLAPLPQGHGALRPTAVGLVDGPGCPHVSAIAPKYSSNAKNPRPMNSKKA